MAEAPLALLLEYLDATPQPTFVAQLTHRSPENLQAEDGLQLIHANPALSRLEPLHTKVISQLQQSPGALGSSRPGNGRKTDQETLTIDFCGTCWTVTTVGDQWLIAATEAHIQVNKRQLPEPVRASPSQDPATCDRQSYYNVQASKVKDASTAQEPYQRPPLGIVNPHGHLGDLHFLEWMHQVDWESSPIGPISGWPAELRTVCEFALGTSEPVNILWGDQCTLLYNQAYSIVVGDKHPRAMGKPFKQNFPQWPQYHQILDKMKESGQTVRQEKVQRMLVRDGFLEEDYFDFTLIPILTADGSVGGFSTRVHEVTRQVIFERRMQILVDTNKAIATTYTIPDLCTAAAGVLDKYANDIHFAAIYSVNSSAPTLSLTLESTAGMNERFLSTHHTITLEISRFGLHHSLLEACGTHKAIVLSTSNGTLDQATLDQLQDCGVGPCREVVVHPMKCFVEDNKIAAVMVVGLSPLRKFDEDYQSFLRLLTRQIENGITVAKGLLREKALHRAQVASEMEGRFWRFAESAPVGMYMYDSKDVLTYWNTAFENICGTAGQALNEPLAWMNTIHPDNIPDVTAVWESYTQSRRDEAISFEVQFKKPWTSKGDDAEVTLDRTYGMSVIQPEYSDDGKLKGTLGCVTDISSLKWAEKMQSARLSEAIEQKRQQENFLDVTSHEMRNPLNAIFQCAYELTENMKKKLKNKSLTNEQAATLHESLDLATTITYCANHQKRIVDDVLTLSKLDARLLQIYPESTNPVKLYREILGLFGPEIRASGMNTNYTIGEGYNSLELKRVMMDPNRVTQIVINLLSNAIKFTKKGKKRNLEITLNAHTEEPANKPMGIRYVPSGVQHQDPTDQPWWGSGEAVYLSFSVKDSGLGMTPEEASNLFQKFAQASPRTHTQFGGSGLGLYISRNLAELHGGRIGLSSHAGFGSTFEFYVKVRRSEVPEVPNNSLDKSIAALDLEQKTITSPVMQQAQPTQLASRSSTEAHTQRAQSPLSLRTNVLIVEDNLINQRLLRKLITKHGYDATVANNGEEALAFMANSTWNPMHAGSTGDAALKIDIVLCDIEMPVMDGKTCARRVRQLQQDNLLCGGIPMIAITGNARLEQVEEMRQCGFDDVVTKPYRIDQLLRVIQRFI